MKDTLNEYIEKIQRKHHRYRQYIAVVLVLAVVTVFGVNWELHQKGISMTGDYVCGYEEHQHTDDCYSNELICGQEESEEHQHTEACYERVLTCQIPEHIHTEACLAQDETPAANSEATGDEAPASDSEITEDASAQELDSSFSDGETSADQIADESTDNGTPDVTDGDGGTAVASVDSSASMSSYVTGLSGEGTKYDKNGKLYSSNLRMNFTFSAGTVNSSNLNYYYEYPDGIIVPDGLLGEKKDLYDSDGKKAGVYYFEKTEDGKYRVRVDFDENYVDGKNGDITGYIQFSGQIDESKADDAGNIKIIGSDNVTLDIPSDKITYPDGVTNKYEIDTSKEGSYSIKDGKLVYTVWVDSQKGTPGDIDFKDKITTSGLTVGDPSVTVTKVTMISYLDDKGNFSGDSIKNQEAVGVNASYKDGELSFTLPKIDPASTYTNEENTECKEYTRYKIEYTYDVTNIDNVIAKANNTASVISKNDKTEIKSESKKEISINNSNEYTIEKTGTCDNKAGYIKWRITVNKNGLNIAGAELNDAMLAKMFENQYTISPSDGYEFIRDENGKITGIKFNAADENGENRNTYSISYNTPAQTNWNGDPVENTATFIPADGNGEISDTGTADVDGGGKVTKTAGEATETGDDNTIAINWTVKISAPTDAIPSGTVITDDPTKDKWGTKGGTQYRTRQQVIDWAGNIYWADSNGKQISKLSLTEGDIADVTFLASDGQTYTWQQINESADDSLTYTIGTVTLKQNLQTPENAVYLIFNYDTTADISEAGSGTTYYKNSVKVGSQDADANYEYNKGGVIKTDENNATDTTQKTNEDGALTWKIKVTTAKDTSKLIFTDDLPVGVTLVSLSGADNLNGITEIALSEDGKISGYYGSYKLEGTYTNGKLTLEVTPKDTDILTPGKYTLVVNGKVDTDSITDYKAGSTYTFTNNASVRDDKGEIGSADQTQEWTEDTDHSNAKIVDKSGSWNNDTRRITYSVKLNPYGKDLVEGSEFLTLKDVFTYYSIVHGVSHEDYMAGNTDKTTIYNVNAWLVPDSVKLYKGVPDGNGGLTKGEQITNWTWTVETSADDEYPNEYGAYDKHSTLTGENLPDSTPMILEYDYQMQTDMPTDWHTTMSPSNTAELFGTSYKDTLNDNKITWSKQESSGEVSTGIRGVLYKVSQGNYGKTLPGATFKLQKYDFDNGYVDTGITYTTDEGGKIVIQWSDNKYEHNVLYRVVETEAPEGYQIAEDPEANAVYFYFSSKTDTTHTLPWNLKELAPKAADLSAASSIFYVENESNSTEVTINKKWLDVNGNADSSHTTGSIRVELYQIAGTGSNTATLKGDIKTGDVTWSNVWKSFDEKEYPIGTTISFVITVKNPWCTNEPDMYVNDIKITPVRGSNDDGNTTYTYTFTLSSGDNTILGAVKDTWQPDIDYALSEVTAQEPEDGGNASKKTLYGTYDITSKDNWSKTISNLPAKGKNENGETVYYTYYVKEVGNNNYNVSYDNNEGIASGTITIKNQTSDKPSYELPETGGSGTTWFTTVGITLMSAVLLYGYSVRLKRKRSRLHSRANRRS